MSDEPKKLKSSKKQRQCEDGFVKVPEMCSILDLDRDRVEDLLDRYAFNWCFVGTQRRTTLSELHQFMKDCITGKKIIPGVIEHSRGYKIPSVLPITDSGTKKKSTSGVA